MSHKHNFFGQANTEIDRLDRCALIAIAEFYCLLFLPSFPVAAGDPGRCECCRCPHRCHPLGRAQIQHEASVGYLQ